MKEKAKVGLDTGGHRRRVKRTRERLDESERGCKGEPRSMCAVWRQGGLSFQTRSCIFLFY